MSAVTKNRTARLITTGGAALATVTALVLTGSPADASPAFHTKVPRPVVQSTPVAGTHRSHYGAARHNWITSSKVASAEQGKYLHRAAAELTASHHHGTAARQLRALAALPETDTTRAQQREAAHLLNALRAFFHTPGLYR